MGADKALVEVAGTAMARRVAGALAAAGCTPVWCQGGDAAALGALGLVVRADHRPGQGPAAAITDVARWLATADADAGAVVAACDLPGLTAAAVAALVGRPRPAALGVDGRPALVVWLPPGAVSAVAASRATRYTDLLAEISTELVPIDPAVVRNVNSPDQL